MATSPLFGWTEPDDTDLVKDGAAAIRTLGNAIDTSMGDLLGGTTGQVLTKNSNTNMDFTWTAVDPLIILDAKGDLITATAADTPARLPVGTNGQVLTADSAETTGLKWVSSSSGFNTAYAYTSSTQNTSSGSYTDLSTTTSVTVTTGTKALVSIKSQFGNESLGAGVWGRISFAVSGATTIAAANERSIGGYSTLGSQWIIAAGGTFLVDTLTAGSNTFTLKFTAAGGYTTPATFYERSISVVNLGS
jgi:hypothetical protein